ncbi:P-type ATPase, putative [Plasmodium sp. DRC-Itaito]|nr:P-type ATPase, putative [Plasmodium sp. DRC-Itaito]
MKILEWISCTIKGKHNENKIYLISNFEFNKDEHEYYIKNAQNKIEEEDLNIDIIYGKKHKNEIRTAKYKLYSFLPLIVFFQFLRLGNLYFLSISMLQLIPEITDSKGMPTYLIPLVFIIVVAMIKEFFEDWQRHKSDNEENSKKTMVFEQGELKEKKWADVKDGDVVKIFSYEYFPADLIVLNCSNKKGIVNIETKNVDGESNVKQKYCLPDISKYFSDDKSAGFCRIELISERPNDNIFDYKGYMILPPLQYKNMKNGKLVHFYNTHYKMDDNKDEHDEKGTGIFINENNKYDNNDPHILYNANEQHNFSDMTKNDHNIYDDHHQNGRHDNNDDNNFDNNNNNNCFSVDDIKKQVQKEETVDKKKTFFTINNKKKVYDTSSSNNDQITHINNDVISENKPERRRRTLYSKLTFNKSFFNNKNENEKLNKRNSTLSSIGNNNNKNNKNNNNDDDNIHNGAYDEEEQKLKKENFFFKEHKRDQKLVQITIDNLVLRGTSLVNTKWIYGLVINTGNRTKLMKNASTKSRQKWSRLEFVYGNHVIVLIICQVFISLIVAIAGVLWMRRKGYTLWYLNLDQTSDSLKTFFITIGSMILLFGSFIPVDLLLIWEVVRLLQGYLINWDNDMYSEKTGRHALSKAGQLLEEMGNVTHIYSDKTGTLTQNVMQLQNIGLGNKGTYGFYDFSNIKENIAKSRHWGSQDPMDPVFEDYDNEENGHGHLNDENKNDHGTNDSDDNNNNNDDENDDEDDDRDKDNDIYCDKDNDIHRDKDNDIYRDKDNDIHRDKDNDIYRDKYNIIHRDKDNGIHGEHNVHNHNYDNYDNYYLNNYQRQNHVKNKPYNDDETNFYRNNNLNKEKTRRSHTFLNPLNWSNTSINTKLKKKKSLFYNKNSLANYESLLNSTYTEDDFIRGENEFVFFNRLLFVNKIYSIRHDVQDQIYFLLLVLSLCHSAMIRNVDIDEMDNNEDDNNNNEKLKIYDKETDMVYTYITQTQPQYDASSPDELALISTSLYLGCEFVNRPNLTTIEIELSSTFAQRFILGEKKFEKFLEKKKIYEKEFDTYFPDVIGCFGKEKKKESIKINENINKGNTKDDYMNNFHMSIPIKNIFGSNKIQYKEEIKSEEKIIKKVVPILSFEILDVFAFDNVRKRMSLIVKNEKKEIFMLVKGADTSVLKLASKNQENIVDHVEHQLHAFATSGLRTLVLGYKHLTENEFTDMYRNHIDARKKSETDKEEYLQEFYEEAENNLIIIGCTGIDDKLQDDVPQVIQDLRDAGMTICVLTGDKLETAINIGHSINILNKQTYNAIFTETDPALLLEQINIHEKNTNAANLLNVDHGTKWWNSVNWENLNLDLRSETILNFMKSNFHGSIKKSIISSNMFNMKNNNSFPSLARQDKVFNSFLESSESFCHNNELDKTKGKEQVHYSQFSITITGEALDVIMKDKILKIKFYTLARSASTLIACRVTPKQKSLLVKENSAFNPRGTSLAIGDGANDVGMILMANVGVGIAGKEGLQAARSSDFTISEFKYLKKLLFVHGRESLRRNSFLVYFCIFRNVSFCLCSMILIFWTGYSAIDAWNPWTKQIINIAFTSLPVIFFVALDKQLPHNILLNNPLLYETSPSTLWPFYSNRKMEFYTNKVKSCYKSFYKFFFFPIRYIPYIQRYTEKIKSWIGKRSKPEKYRTYGTHYLFVYLLFAIWLATVETVIMLHFSTGQAYSSSLKDNHHADIDFNTFSQILYTHHVIAVNIVVVLMTNTWFFISHVVLWVELIATFFFWFIISNTKFFLDIVGADELHGTFEKAHSSGNYYASLIISLYISILPLLILMTYQFIKKPTMEQIVLEQLKLGKFEGLRKYEIKKLAYIDNQKSSNEFNHKGFAFAVEAKEAFWGLVQKAIYKIKMPLLKDETGNIKHKRKS